MSLEKIISNTRLTLNNWFFRRLSLQTLLIGVTQLITIIILSTYTSILTVSSFQIAVIVTIMYSLTQSFFWYFFVRFAGRLHPFLYPIIMFFLSGLFVLLTTKIIPGFSIPTLLNSIETVCLLTFTSTVAAVIFGMDEDRWFDFNVVNAIVKQYGKTQRSTDPGFIFLEIDGLSWDILQKAISEGYMPTVKRWLTHTHTLTRWETDLSSQSGAMQAGILQGNNTDIPAFYWYDREKKRIVNSASPMDAMATESRLTNHHGLLEKGGASRGNMFSGDATENLFTFSTLFDKQRGRSPGFYLFLFNPYVASRIITKFCLEILFEIKDGLKQWIFDRKRPHVSRAFPYPLMRGVMNSLMPELVTYIAIIDIFRGIPAMYLLYPGYDDLAHYSGIAQRDSLRALASIDSYFSRIERILKQAPRPYHLVVLSDHGQSEGVYFKKKYGIGLEELVKSLITADMHIYATLESNEASYLINSVLTDASHQHLKTSHLLKKTLKQQTNNGYVDISAKTSKDVKNKVAANAADLIVLASGSLGLIYAGQAPKRITYEQIEELFPHFLQGLVDHEGIGYIMVNSEKTGGIVLGKHGKYFLKTGRVEGTNPLLPYGKHAAMHLSRENTYSNAPDILVNTSYDDTTGEISGFELQVGHHGGLGGYQNRPFLLSPKELPVKADIVGAMDLYTVLHNWRKKTS